MIIGSCYSYFASQFFFFPLFWKEVLQLWWFFFCLFFDLTNRFPGGSVVKNLPTDPGDGRVRSLRREDPCRRKRQPTQIFLPGESHRQRNLVDYRPWGHRVRLDATECKHACAHACSHTHTHAHRHTHTGTLLGLLFVSSFGCSVEIVAVSL